MAKVIPLSGSVVVRDGKRVRPTIGQPFTYTAAEMKTLEAAGFKHRKPSDDPSDEETAAVASSTTGQPGVPPSAEASQSAARGGKKPATAAKSDAENAGKDNPKANTDSSGDDDL